LPNTSRFHPTSLLANSISYKLDSHRYQTQPKYVSLIHHLTLLYQLILNPNLRFRSRTYPNPNPNSSLGSLFHNSLDHRPVRTKTCTNKLYCNKKMAWNKSYDKNVL